MFKELLNGSIQTKRGEQLSSGRFIHHVFASMLIAAKILYVKVKEQFFSDTNVIVGTE